VYKFNLSLIPLLLSMLWLNTAIADPTRPPAWLGNSIQAAPQQSAGQSYLLQQILVSEQRRLAIINGELVSEGQSIQNARVVNISFDKVVLRVGSKKKTLTLAPETKEVINAQ